VANTATDDERRIVESELNRSDELKQELHMLQRVRAIAVAREEFQKEGHLTPEEIVLYAEGTLAGKAFAAAERHLATCDSCRSEVTTIKETYAAQPIPTVRRQKRNVLLEFFTSLKPAVVIPALAAVVICSILVFRHFSTPDAGAIRFALNYQPQLRGSEESALPHLEVMEKSADIDFVIAIPHTSILSTRYTVVLENPDGTLQSIAEGVQAVAGSATSDTVRVTIGSNRFLGDGTYTIKVRESAGSLPGGVEAQELPIRFGVKRTGKN
jgi:hypothetical protein